MVGAVEDSQSNEMFVVLEVQYKVVGGGVDSGGWIGVDGLLVDIESQDGGGTFGDGGGELGAKNFLFYLAIIVVGMVECLVGSGGSMEVSSLECAGVRSGG